MNVWAFTGNLGRDAEQRFTSSGDSIVSFSVGVKSGFGEKASTTWARCSLFGKRGESVLPYLNKGQLVGVSGEVSMREWSDKEGGARVSLEVRVGDLTLLGRRDDNQQSLPRQSAREAAPRQTPSVSTADMGDDIPW